MRALGICLLCWKFAMVSSDSTFNTPNAILRTTETLEHLQKHKLDPMQLHFEELENQTVLDGLTIHEVETETKLKLELTRLQHRSRWKRCLTCGKKPVMIRSVQTRSRRYNTYLSNKVTLLQRTVGKLTLSLRKTKAKVKKYEKWKNSSEIRFRKLEAMVEQLQRGRGNSIPSPGILTSDELIFISSDHNRAGQQEQTPTTSTEAINTNTRRKNRKRTTSSNFSMNGNVLNFEEIAKAVVALNSSFPTYRKILYKLHNRVSRFNRYIIKRQQNLQRLVSSSMRKNDEQIRSIYSKILDLTERIESDDFVDSVRNATVDRVLDELEPDLSSVLHQSLDDLNATYHGKFALLNEKVALNKGTILAFSRRLGRVRVSNIRMRKHLQNSIDSLRNTTRTKILWQNQLFTKAVSSIITVRKDTEDKIDSISNFVIDTRSDVQNLNQSLEVIHRARSKDESASISFLDRNITDVQSKVDVLQQKQAAYQEELKTLLNKNVMMQRKNITDIENKLNQRLEQSELHAYQDRERLRGALASCCKDSVEQIKIHRQVVGQNPIPNSSYVGESSTVLGASPTGIPPSALESGKLQLDESSVAALQLKLEDAVEKRIQTRMKAIDGATRDLKQVKSDLKILNEAVERMNSTIISDYVTLSEYQKGAKQMEHRIGATMSQTIEEIHKVTHNDTSLLENRLLVLENTTVISDEVLHQIINSSKILKEQMAKLHFFRAFVFLKLGANAGKNLSQIEAIMDRMRDDIDFNYNTTQLITDYVKGQDSRISLLSNEIQDVLFVSESVEEQKISLEELNYTLTEKQNQMSRLLDNVMAAFDTSNYVVRRLRQDLDFMKKNTSNHFIRSFTNLEYLTQIVKETNIAVEENSDRLEEMNSTLLYLEISYEDPVSSASNGGLLPNLEPPFESKFPSGNDNWIEPGLVSFDDESSDIGNLTGTDYPYLYGPTAGDNGNEGEASAWVNPSYDYTSESPNRRVGRSIMKGNTNLEERKDNSIDHLVHETNPIKIAPITEQAAFSVGLTNAFDCCGPVRFNKVFANRRGRYDVYSGKFTAEVAGHYVFYVTTSKKNSFVHAALVHNDISTISIRMEHSTGGYCGQNQSSNSVVLVMEPGDQVWLQTYSGSLKGYPSPSTTFSGFLISG